MPSWRSKSTTELIHHLLNAVAHHEDVWGMNKKVMNERHILFQEDQDTYIKTMLETVVDSNMPKGTHHS